MSLSLTGIAVTATEVDPSTNEPAWPLDLEVDGRWIQLQPRFTDGVGVLHADGYRPSALGWVEGACVGLIELERGPVSRVTGVVQNPADAVGDTWVSGCQVGAMIESDRSFELSTSAEGPCELSIYRVFGTTDLFGPKVEVQLTHGEEVRVNLVAPELPLEPGWSVMEVDDAFRIMGVAPGSSAERAGLAMGDRIVGVDGLDAADLTEEALEDLPAALEVERDGEVRRVVVRPL
ncbi:MAG: hypothetical protein ACI8PZ_002275 [Myxococcota bacterium]